MPLGVLTADIPVLDDCPVLTRMKAYVTQLGVVPTIHHVVRDRKGQPIDLSDYFNAASQSDEGEGIEDSTVWLRSKELVAEVSAQNRVQEVKGRCLDPDHGLLAFDLSGEMVERAGVFQLSVAIKDPNQAIKYVENPILWVERSLFGSEGTDQLRAFGPPSIQELRQAIMDNGAAENLLLDDVEFTDDQIAAATGRPLQVWNSVPPPLRPAMDTRSFPFREQWMGAICGHLFVAAAHNYRRNRLAYNAGGVAVDDKNKEPEYLKMGQALLDEWKEFVTLKKYEINTGLFVGHVGSIYGGIFY
jgi:hypothetical protein